MSFLQVTLLECVALQLGNVYGRALGRPPLAWKPGPVMLLQAKCIRQPEPFSSLAPVHKRKITPQIYELPPGVIYQLLPCPGLDNWGEAQSFD